MLKVHHLNNSRSHRVLWLLEELEVPYEIVHYQRDPKTMLAPESLKKVHPLGKSPVVTDGEMVLAESGAIIETLIEKYGQGRLSPSSEKERIQYLYWMHFAEGSAMSPLLLKLIFSKIETDSPRLVKPITGLISKKIHDLLINPNLRSQFNFMEGHLSKNPWFGGEVFSGADIQMSFPVEAGESRMDFSRFPKLRAFLKSIRSRPAYQRAIERGGPLEL